MKITFDQTAEDIKDLSRHSLKSNNFLKIFGIIMLVILLFSAFDFFSDEGFNMATILSWVIPLILIVVIWVVIFRVFLKKRLQNSGNQKMMFGRREIELLEDKITVTTPVAETTYQWAAVTKLGETAKNYFLYLGNAQAIIISKSAFENEQEIAAFEQLVTAKIGQKEN